MRLLANYLRIFLLQFSALHWKLPVRGASNRRADFSLRTTTLPSTRLRGQIGCFSCVSWTDWHGDFRQTDAPKSDLFDNKSELSDVFSRAGMRVPKWSGRCAETNPTARPNFAGAQLHICENSAERPGACVKLKGQYKGRWYVYRECWDRMWAEPRGYHHEYSGKCYADQPVQQFVGTERNVLCFCEEDLCNGARGPGGWAGPWQQLVLLPVLFATILVHLRPIL